eukprot:TRINITY_DN2221_c0_g2_i5.p1 TRINITY_DN2221_c0_g2~~TRINITY_DN2221_c0_g2_i5.p1  ORF type:complete len:151 (-),score=42.18 TRINITY_DN2221_c0_g2_i5:89-541(-)
MGTGKLIINDDEDLPQSLKKGKRAKAEVQADSVSDSEMKPSRKKKAAEEKGKQKAISKKNPAKALEGHFAIHSGEEYKSKSGKGDVWKKGQKYEPYAYIRFNPKMVNPKRRKLALKSFENVVNQSKGNTCLLYTSPSPRDLSTSRMPSSA